MTETPAGMTVTPDRARASADVLDQVLGMLQLEGAIFLLGEYTAPWAYESPPQRDLLDVMRPGSRRLVLFHIMARGRCWIQVGEQAPVWVEQGDVIVLPYADQHVMGFEPDGQPVNLLGLLEPPPWPTLPIIRLGGGGAPTSIVCGYLLCEDLLFDPVISALPSLFTIRPEGSAAAWVEASVRYAMDAASAGGVLPRSAIATRLPELLFIEVMRMYLEARPPGESGLLAAIRDDVVAPALAALHRDPSRRWSVADLAREAASSRSVLDERFRRTLGRPPMRYLTEWRLQLASKLLAEPSLRVAEIAERVGYESEEAFSRAFKRFTGLSPSQARAPKESMRLIAQA